MWTLFKSLILEKLFMDTPEFLKIVERGFCVSIYQIPAMMTCYLQCIIRSRKFSFFGCTTACGISVPQPGTEPGPPAVGAWRPDHWTSRGFPKVDKLWTRLGRPRFFFKWHERKAVYTDKQYIFKNLRNYYQWLEADNLEKWNEMEKFLEKLKKK